MMMKVRHYPGHSEPVDTKSMAAQYENNWKEVDAKWRVNDRSKIKINTNSTNNSNSWSYEQYTRPPVLSNYPKANTVAAIRLNGVNDHEPRRSPGEDKPNARTTTEPVNNSKTAKPLNSCQSYTEPEPNPTMSYKDFHKSKESINVERLDQIIHNPNANPFRYHNRQRVAPELIDDSWIPPPESVNLSSSQSHSLSRRSFHIKNSNNVPNSLKRVKSLHVNSILDQKERKSSFHEPIVNSDPHESQNVIVKPRQLDAWDVVVPSLSQTHNKKPLDLRKSDSAASVRLLAHPEKNGRKPQRSSPVEIEPDYPVQNQQTDTSNGDFIIPRPKFIVPVHTYGMRKRRTGATLSNRKGSEEVDAPTKNSLDIDKKHHTSCPGEYNCYNYEIIKVKHKLNKLSV
uniref:Uncharacterized protein n=1 Tax=Cacopsylla melanoneura TaxID=428564 RepID=A0A8D8Z4D0_9HEMI